MTAALRIVCACALLAPAAAHAGGFSVSEVGSRESGRGTAAAALTDTASAIFYNPANIAAASGLRLQLGASVLMPQWQHKDLDTGVISKSNPDLSTPPHFALSYNFGDVGLGSVAAGVGFFVPYGSTFSWPADWAGRSEIQNIALQVFEVSPAIAWRPHKAFSIGATFRYLPANVYLKQAVQFGSEQEGTVALSGSGSGMGAAVGIGIYPVEGLSIGLAWRSRVVLSFTGQSNFDFPPPFDTQAIDRDVKTSVALPHNFRLGVAYEGIKDLSVSADVEYQGWSSYKDLTIKFQNADGTEQVSSSPRNSMDSWVFHVGGEYRVHPNFAVRAGYVWDQHTLPEETVNPAPPDSDKHVISVGLSGYFGDFGVHVNFADVIFAKRTSYTAPFPGEWQGAYPGGTMAYIFGLSVSAALDFGGKKDDAAPAPQADEAPVQPPTPAESTAAPAAN